MAQPEDAADGKLTWTKALPPWEPLAGYPPLQGCALGLEYSGACGGEAEGAVCVGVCGVAMGVGWGAWLVDSGGVRGRGVGKGVGGERCRV